MAGSGALDIAGLRLSISLQDPQVAAVYSLVLVKQRGWTLAALLGQIKQISTIFFHFPSVSLPSTPLSLSMINSLCYKPMALPLYLDSPVLVYVKSVMYLSLF